MQNQLVTKSSKLLAENKLTIAFAESATAGKLSYEFSLTPDSGKILKGGLVCYDASIKEDVLDVPHELIEKYTPESPEVTKELARRLYKVVPSADVFIAVTGLTTPGGSETPEKPVGTMFIHAVVNGKDFPVREVFTGSAEQIIRAAIERVDRLLIEVLADIRITGAPARWKA
ncbi:CinA family protein [Flavihumibacter sp. R14]|nr:CinA family protein [Flavihumibacter soli]